MDTKEKNSSTDDDYKYLIDCETNKQISKSDAIRSKLFQLNALQNTFEEKVFNKLRLNLMNELSKEIDRKDGKNTFLSPANHWANTSSRGSKHNQWKSHLYSLSEENLFQKFNIKRKDMKHFKKGERVIALKTNKESNKSDANDVQMSDISVVNSTKHCENNIFAKVGHLASTSTPNKSILVLSQNSSPTRVSGIFKRNNGQNSPINAKINGNNSDNKWKDTQIGNSSRTPFMTGLERKLVDDVRKGSMNIEKAKKVLSNVRQQPFKNPIKANNDEKSVNHKNELLSDERLKNIDPLMIETIQSEIISNLEPIEWSNIAGLEFAKSKIQEIAIVPLIRPDLFQRIRAPPKGILLFGPPGTGKTLIGRCIASETKSTFFSITVSSLTSKWIGEGEKLIKAMFSVARCRQPAVIFIDEIDSLLKSRCDTEHESSRRMKTEFLAQFEGVSTQSHEQLLIIGATNRPQELDDAARRRLSAKLYIPLPDMKARKQIIRNCIDSEKHNLTDEQIDDLALKTDGYSGADMKDLCRESAMESFRDLMKDIHRINEIDKNEMRGITYEDFVISLNVVKPSVSTDDIKQYEEFNQKYGTNLFKTCKT